jgi:hypothetical protein
MTSKLRIVGLAFFFMKQTSGFVILQPPATFARISSVQLFSVPNAQEMKAGEIRSELESYGISTKSFLEKKELIKALETARKQRNIPYNDVNGCGNKDRTGWGSRKTKVGKKDEGKNNGIPSREERLATEMENAKTMKVGDLKKELQNLGVSTRSFFEKTEFVKAYAEAIVDGAEKAAGKKKEAYDASYRDVSMQKMDSKNPRLLQGTIIDVQL